MDHHYHGDGGAFALPDELAAGGHFILCCQCGVQIAPNPAAMCVNCIRTQVDITDGIPKQSTLFWCRGCGRYLNPPNAYVNAEPESRELLALCLRKLKTLNKVRLVDAGFIWTEPHSKRIKVKITIQKEVFSGTILQQVFVVEYIVAHQMCEQCHRREAKDTWNAVVQVRQKVRHKRTFFYLEQLIIKHNAHRQTVRIKSLPDGIDFYYSTATDARKMVEFLSAAVPARSKTSERLISHDIHSNTFNYKYSYSVEIVPVCKDDIVCLPRKLCQSLGNISPFNICTKVGNSLHFIDPMNLHHVEMPSSLYWRFPFASVAGHGQYTEFCVLDIEPVLDHHGNPVEWGKFLLADCQIMRVRDMGENDIQFMVRTHLGHILQPGDNVWGFDFTCAVTNEENSNAIDPSEYPDVMLVKKSYTEKRKQHKKRNWKLQLLDKDEDGLARRDGKDVNSADRDLEEFMQELEEDPEMRAHVNIYRDAEAEVESTVDPEDAELRVGVEEMLDEFDAMQLDAEGGPDAEDGGEGAAYDPSLEMQAQEEQYGHEGAFAGLEADQHQDPTM